MKRNNDEIKLTKFEKTLAEEQHNEMCIIVDRIEEVGKDDLEKVFADGDVHGVSAQIREVWVVNIAISSYNFLATGKHSNQWSMITIRIGK